MSCLVSQEAPSLGVYENPSRSKSWVNAITFPAADTSQHLHVRAASTRASTATDHSYQLLEQKLYPIVWLRSVHLRQLGFNHLLRDFRYSYQLPCSKIRFIRCISRAGISNGLIFSIGMQPVCCLVKRDDHEESVFMRKVRVCSSNNVVRGCSAWPPAPGTLTTPVPWRENHCLLSPYHCVIIDITRAYHFVFQYFKFCILYLVPCG